ncbi:class I SAM-dependent methyltransferase [Alteromonas sp. ASW11-130]|uniref:class I SAM-dependent methyltransferase n=1 Tax=Alteromonas sp. ASW11-130 TaxID=3015775 RepID=UPI002242888D|nr:class I SAM-dependent methyltransferase [Alteromonas sp. ASW11-130]MCW8093449.1 class I SAM-dependent methyltransferase [Alteromonas sp. ASW11-130]
MSNHACPLCQTNNTEFYIQDKRRSYWQCQTCDLVFVEKKALPSTCTELNEYKLHENDAEDEGYKNFLSRLAIPLLDALPLQQCGLDFGCGPSPVLAQILEDAGHEVAIYDPFFQPDESVLTRKYDFISCTEAIEHFHNPHRELELWHRLLKSRGWLAIMTKRVLSKERFINWHYKNDQTHVSFFSEKTFNFIAKQWGFTLHIVTADVVLLQKNSIY